MCNIFPVQTTLTVPFFPKVFRNLYIRVLHFCKLFSNYCVVHVFWSFRFLGDRGRSPPKQYSGGYRIIQDTVTCWEILIRNSKVDKNPIHEHIYYILSVLHCNHFHCSWLFIGYIQLNCTAHINYQHIYFLSFYIWIHGFILCQFLTKTTGLCITSSMIKGKMNFDLKQMTKNYVDWHLSYTCQQFPPQSTSMERITR